METDVVTVATQKPSQKAIFALQFVGEPDLGWYVCREYFRTFPDNLRLAVRLLQAVLDEAEPIPPIDTIELFFATKQLRLLLESLPQSSFDVDE